MTFSNTPSIPPFPADLPVTPLQKLRFSQLARKNDAESRKLFQICSSTGIFLLDLTESLEGEALLTHVNATFELGEKIFNLAIEEKMKYSMLNGTVLGFVYLPAFEILQLSILGIRPLVSDVSMRKGHQTDVNSGA
jgi:isopenicillin N synthase-like dioxygenase